MRFFSCYREQLSGYFVMISCRKLVLLNNVRELLIYIVVPWKLIGAFTNGVSLVYTS